MSIFRQHNVQKESGYRIVTIPSLGYSIARIKGFLNSGQLGEPQARREDALAEFYEKFPHANEATFVTRDSFEQVDQVI